MHTPFPNFKKTTLGKSVLITVITNPDTYRAFLHKPDSEITTPLTGCWDHSYLSDEGTKALGVRDLAQEHTAGRWQSEVSGQACCS